MGLVYKGFDMALGRPAAIKVLPHSFLENEEVIKRFGREARACAQLNHPNIVTVYGVGRAESNFFIAMELVEGQSLYEVMKKRGKLPLREALGIARSVADALHEAHARGIVHRDIKPQNIMLDKANRVKVMDFGLASVQTEASNLTASGSTLGTPKYMSPEQWKDSKVDARSDLYSLGVTLFEMLAGIPPYTADTPLGLMRKIVDLPPPRIREINRDIPERVESIVDRMIAKEPDERFASAEALMAELDAYMSGRDASTRSALSSPIQTAETSSAGLDSEFKDFGADLEQRQAPSAAPPQSPAAPVQRASSPTIQSATPIGTVTAAPDRRNAGVYAAVAIAMALAAVGAGAMFLGGGSGPKVDGTHFRAEDFVWIEPGSFTMGSPPSETGRDDDETPHPVTLTEGFWMSKYEVTQRQWNAYMGSPTSTFTGDDLPVENVTWDEVQVFLNQVNRAEGTGLRLPTEAEWEYACRAGSADAYAFGGAASNLDSYAWFAGNSGGRTHPVGQKQPNRWGLYDMHGNVWEWCQDWAGAYPREATDPTGPTSGDKRIGRGGSFSAATENCRAADRSASSPLGRGSDLGFRVVVSP